MTWKKGGHGLGKHKPGFQTKESVGLKQKKKKKNPQNHGLSMRNNSTKKRTTTTFTEEPIWHWGKRGDLNTQGRGRRQLETGGRDYGDKRWERRKELTSTVGLFDHKNLITGRNQIILIFIWCFFLRNVKCGLSVWVHLTDFHLFIFFYVWFIFLPTYIIA